MRMPLHRLGNRLCTAALVALVWALVPPAPVFALTVMPRSFDELVQLADTVIIGTVTAMHSERSDTRA